MTKKMGLMALGLSMVLFSGCGSSNNTDVDTGTGDTNLNIPTEVENNIVGNWNSDCVDFDEYDNGWSAFSSLKFNVDGTGSNTGTEFEAPGCNPNDELSSWNNAFTYTVGEATLSENGEETVQLDVVLSGMSYYTMIHFITDDKYILATSEGGDINDGQTPETRENVLEDEEWTMYRQ